MAEDSGPTGTDWTSDEIDLVVADYFAMRDMYFSGQNFKKSDHYREISRLTGRTIGSVQRKYMNISAALDQVGLPWLKGFAPNKNLQRSLRIAVEQFVAREWDSDKLLVAGEENRLRTSEFAFDPKPELSEAIEPRNKELAQIARKFDPALRDARNRRLGYDGEKFVYDLEKSRLAAAGKAHLAENVKWVSQDEGDGAGFDILSFDESGSERFLEVKTTVGGYRTPFFLTENERRFASKEAERYRIIRLYDWRTTPRAFLIEPPLESSVILSPTAYRASFS